LGIGEDVLQALLAQDILHSLKKPIGHAGKRTMFLIDRSSIETVRREWAGLLPLEIISRSYLGVTKSVMLMLEQAGLLTPMRGPTIDGYKLRLYSPEVVAQFEETLLSHAEKALESPLEAMIPLPVFASKAGMPLVALLEEILEGRLVPVEIRGVQPLLRRLALPYTEIACFLAEYKRRQREKCELFTPDEVALDLGISERVLRRWAQGKLIEGEKLSIDGKKPSLLFRKQALEEFHRTYAFTEEVAELLGVTLLTVSKYVRRGKLHPVVGRKTQYGGTRLLFLREEAWSRSSHSGAKSDAKAGFHLEEGSVFCEAETKQHNP
jgi:hypothetical protein